MHFCPSGVAPEDVDLVLVATSTPDDIFGSACQVRVLYWGGGLVGRGLSQLCSSAAGAEVLPAMPCTAGCASRE